MNRLSEDHGVKVLFWADELKNYIEVVNVIFFLFADLVYHYIIILKKKLFLSSWLYRFMNAVYYIFIGEVL